MITAKRVQILTTFAIALGAAFLPLFTFGCFDESDKGTLIRLTDVVEVVVGQRHSCALRSDGTVVCWGNNSYGQLGTKAEQDSFETMDPVGITDEKIRGYSDHATIVKGLSGVQQIASGANHNCALLNDRTVRCWGDSSSGQLGNGDFSLDACEGRPCSREPVQVKGLDEVVDLSLGQRYSCAIHHNGALSCWGSDLVEFASDLESCDQKPCATVPVKVPLEQDAIQVVAGYRHACALLADGTVVCWGENSVGQIGVLNPPYQSVQGVNRLTDLQQPSMVGLEEPAERITIPPPSDPFDASNQKSCARLQDGSLYCWGNDDWGQLGIGNQTSEQCWTGSAVSVACSTHPMKVAIEDEVEKYVLAENTGCAITVAGQLYCWGEADRAQLGADAEIEDRCKGNRFCTRTPVLIPTQTAMVDVTLGPRFTCGLRDDDEIDCWGWDFPYTDQDFSKVVDCSSSREPCSVELLRTGRPRKLFVSWKQEFCVLTPKGEIHCSANNFNASERTIRMIPLRVYQ